MSTGVAEGLAESDFFSRELFKVPDNDSLSPIERQLPHRINTFTPTTLDLEAQGSEPHFSFATFWQVVLKRITTIVTATVIVAVLTGIYTFKMSPVYKATATVDVETTYPQLQTLNEVYRQSPVDDNSFLVTQMQVLQSDSLAWTTLQQLGLDRAASPGMASAPGQSAIRIAAARKAALIGDFKEGLSVAPLKDSRILAVSYESGNPELAANAVNRLIDNYTDANFEQRNDFTRRASGGMEQQLQELKVKVEKSQQALIDYERQNLIVSVGDKGTINDERLEQLNRDYTNVESDRVQKQSLYELAKANEGQVGIIVEDRVLQHLEEKYSDLKAAYADALTQYGPNFPKAVRLHDQLTQLQSLMEAARKLAIEKAHNDYLEALSREKLIGEAMAKEKENVSALNQRMIEHNILKREFDINQQLYESLLQRLKDATLSASLQVTNVHVIDPATPPSTPISPNRPRNLAAGLMIGLILGITLAFVQEALDSSVRTAEEAERLVNAPALAVIPAETDGYRRKQMAGGPSLGAAAGPNGVGLAVLKRPSSPMAESFRSLRTSVLLSTAPRPPQTLLVTSAQMGEGKTSTATNLAMSFAQRQGPVLIIDADMRRPSVAKTLGVANERGLSSFLTGAHSLDEVLIQYERTPNLWILPAGPRPPDPAELLSSHMMDATLKDLLKRFTQIVIDSPPLLLVTDAVILSANVDGVILVVASGTTARGALARAHRILENAGSRVLGMVLNKVDMRFDTYYGSYYGPYHQSYYDEASVSNPSHSSGGGHARKDSSRRA